MHKQMTLADTIAIASLALILPGAFFLSLLTLGIEPPLGPLKEILNSPRNQPDVIDLLEYRNHAIKNTI